MTSSFHDKPVVRIKRHTKGPFERLHAKVKKVSPRLGGCAGCAKRAEFMDSLVEAATKRIKESNVGKEAEAEKAGQARNDAAEAKTWISSINASLEVYREIERACEETGRSIGSITPHEAEALLREMSVPADGGIPDRSLRLGPVQASREEDTTGEENAGS